MRTMPSLHSLSTPQAPARPPLTLTGTSGFGYPRTQSQWVERYSWLFDQYVGEPYSVSDIKHLGLFRALDNAGNVIAETRRITADVKHVINTDASAIAKPLSLVLRAGIASVGAVARGESVWRRGRVQSNLRKWAAESGAMGDFFVEAVFRDQGSRPVRYDPRLVQADYDDEGVDLERAVIRVPILDPVTGGGDQLDETMRVYERTLTKTSVIVREVSPYAAGGMKVLDERSYEHNLGVVPMAHVPFIPFGPPEHGLWAAHGMEEVVAAVDSYMTQLRAISNRFANPTLFVKGASLASGSDAQKFGRTWANLPPDSEIGYLEPQLVIGQLWEAIQAFKADQRHTVPEFIFSGSGANTSGEALKLRASEFESKMIDVRGRFYAGLAEVTQMCVMLDDSATDFDRDSLLYRIDAAPILPRDRSSHFVMVRDARAAGLLTRRDGVKHMQAIGLVDAEEDPDVYAAALDAEAPDAAATQEDA